MYQTLWTWRLAKSEKMGESFEEVGESQTGCGILGTVLNVQRNPQICQVQINTFALSVPFCGKINELFCLKNEANMTQKFFMNNF